MITNSDDTIDSRDVTARIEELRDLRDDAGDGFGIWDTADESELTSLTDLASVGQSVSGWDAGVTLVRETYFTEYARDYVTDILAASGTPVPSLIVVDWDATARDLRTDYTEIEWDGVTYYTAG